MRKIKPLKIWRDGGNKFSISGERFLTVKYEKIVPLLIEGIKELSEQNKKQQEEINLLRERNF